MPFIKRVAKNSLRRVVLVSGSSRGLGKNLVQSLCQKDLVVYAGVRQAEQLEVLRLVWQKDFPAIHPVKLDLKSDGDCREAIKEIIAREGRLDVLINCAALVLVGPSDQFSPDDLRSILETNLIGPFRLIKESLIWMRKQNRGQIINITSLNGLVALPNFGLYGASKSGLEALGLSLGLELENQGIKVTNVEPGAILNPDNKKNDLPHKPLREKSFLFRMILPMIKIEDVVRAVEKLMDNPRPPSRLQLGRDAQLGYFFQRFLPPSVWQFLLLRLWKF